MDSSSKECELYLDVDGEAILETTKEDKNSLLIELFQTCD